MRGCIKNDVTSESYVSSKKDIAEYYDYTTPFYKYFWHRSTGAVHYGLKETHTRGLADELLNTNVVLARLVKINSKDKILDAGCGVGGSSIWIAKRFGASVTGNSLSNEQVKKAKENAKQQNVSDKTKFMLMDYQRTTFKTASFDIVWAIESVCHAKPKSAFVNEAYRVLGSGGRLVIADGFLNRDPKSERERRWLQEFCTGLCLPDIVGTNDFAELLRQRGFRKITVVDKTEAAYPSSRRLFWMCLFGYPLAILLETCRITPKLLTRNNKAGIVQYTLVKSGVIGYKVFLAEKPYKK